MFPTFKELFPNFAMLFLGILTFFGLFAFILLLLREINCWYWKLNRIVALLESIESKLETKHEKIVSKSQSVETPKA